MRKIPEEIENPLDNICIKSGEPLMPIFKNMGFTPNGLTSMSLLTGILSIYFFMKNNYLLSGIFFMISYLFDCYDGNFARTYNMVTKFGDLYDHFKDLLINGIITILIFYKYNSADGIVRFLPYFIFIFLILQSAHLGCQEIYNDNHNDKNENSILSNFKYMCPSKDKDSAYRIMGYTRYFGCGTNILYMLFLILYSYEVDKIK